MVKSVALHSDDARARAGYDSNVLPICECGVRFWVSGFMPCVCPAAVNGGHTYYWCRRCRDFVFVPPCHDDGETKEYGRR